MDIIFAVLALISVLPALLVRYPESVDYLNHLARLSVLTAPADDPIHAVYRVHWHLIPNLGLELIAMPLALLLPLEAVMKIIWVFCVLGLAGAVWFLHRSLYARTQPTLLLGALALLSLPIMVGLMSFTLGLILALAAVGLWLRLGDRATLASILALNALAGVILIVHVAACASLALTLGALYVLREPYDAAGMTKRAAAIASGFVLPAMLLAIIALSNSAPATTADAGAIKYIFFWKAQLPIAPVFTGNIPADILAALLLWLTLVIAPRFGARCDRRFIAPLLLWFVVLLALPFSIGSATIIDLRQAVFPVLLLIGALSFAPARRAWSGGAIIAIAIVGVLARTAILIPEWRAHDAHVASFRGIEGIVERGAKVIVATAPTVPGACGEMHFWAPFEEHIPVLLVIDRAAFVSTLFAAPGLQPIEPMPPVSDMAVPDLGIVPWAVLAASASPAGQEQTASVMSEDTWRVYVRDWRKNYDYLALRRLNCPGEIPSQPDLVPVADSATYRLYRIAHPAG